MMGRNIAFAAILACCGLPLIVALGAGGLVSLSRSGGSVLALALVVTAGLVGFLVYRRRAARRSGSLPVGSDPAALDDCCAPTSHEEPGAKRTPVGDRRLAPEGGSLRGAHAGVLVPPLHTEIGEMMIRNIAIAATLALAFSVSSARALEKTAVLSVENATCALCGPIVKRTLERVPGVSTVRIVENYAMSPPVTARVVFDDAVTNVEALMAATTNAGYPSSLAPFGSLATTGDAAAPVGGGRLSFLAPLGRMLPLALIAIAGVVGLLIYGRQNSEASVKPPRFVKGARRW